MQLVDASIPLGVKQAQFDTPTQAYGQAMNMKNLQATTELKNLDLAQGLQTLKDQQELAHLAGDPANIDPATGGFKPEAMTKITNPILRQKLNQSRMQQLKEQADINWKTSQTALNADEQKTKALHGVMEEAYSTYEDTRARTGNDQAATDAFNKALAGGYEDLRATGRGGFPKDTQFKMLTPQEVGAKLITHKERVAEEAAKGRGEETPIIKETRYVEKLKGQLADLAPGDPGAASLKQQIAVVQGHIARMDRIPGGQTERTQPPANFRWVEPGNPAAGVVPIKGGPKDPESAPARRDVLQADALAAYRARYPYGYMKEMYGKDQPTPEEYTETYIKAKEGGGKGMPKDVKGAPPKVSNKAEFDKLKPGDRFIDARDGKEKIKGK